MINVKISLYSLMTMLLLYKGELSAVSRQKKVQALPSNTIIAWDFHDVIAYKQLGAIASHGISLFKDADNRWELIKLFLSPSFWKAINNAHNCGGSGDRCIELLIQKYPDHLARYRSEIYKLASFYEVNVSVMTIIKQLHKSGYKQVLASNIGTESLVRMQQKYPELFSLFDALYFDGARTKEGKLYTSLIKPHSEYFVGLRHFLDDKGFKQPTIIFIDDKRENILGAHKANVGIEGIHFVSTRQLSRVLKKKGMLIELSAINS